MHYTRMLRHGSYDTPLTPREKTLLNGEIRCAKCETLKSKDDFYEDGRTYSGYSPYCKSCNSLSCKQYRSKTTRKEMRNRQLQADYGLTLEQYHMILTLQNNACAICGKTDEYRALCVDHDHKTGKVRGILCSSCNRALGYFHDRVDVLKKAMAYIEKNT